MSTCIWCPLVMLNERYASAAVVMAKSLRNTGTKYPIWCMVSDGISDGCISFLKNQFDNVITVPIIEHKVTSMKSKKQNFLYGSWIHKSFTKWNILNPKYFPGIDKIILIDVDMLFRENCDSLFELPAPALTFSSPWSNLYTTKGWGCRNHYGEMRHGQQVDNTRIRQGLYNGIVGLACMVLVSPSEIAYNTMLTILNSKEIYGNPSCISGFDEQLLAETLLSVRQPIYHIHQQYNWIVGKNNWLLNGEIPKTQQYYGEKPWHNIMTPEDRIKVTESPWDDVREFWAIADQVMQESPDSYSLFYPGVKY